MKAETSGKLLGQRQIYCVPKRLELQCVLSNGTAGWTIRDCTESQKGDRTVLRFVEGRSANVRRLQAGRSPEPYALR